MSMTNDPPRGGSGGGPFTPPPVPGLRPRRLTDVDGFMCLQALIVVTLASLAAYFLYLGDTRDASLLGVGLLGALQLHRKPSGPGQ